MDIYAMQEEAYHRGYENGQPKWISVNDRMPEEGAFVLTYKPYAYFPISIDRCFNGQFSVTLYAITHWMPLPEPPKGSDD